MEKIKEQKLFLSNLLFSIVEIVLIILVFITDGDKEVISKAFAILVNVLFSTYFYLKYNSKSLVPFALTFTFLSDSLLVFNIEGTIVSKTSGMAIFTIVHLLYSFELFKLNKSIGRRLNIFKIIGVLLVILISIILFRENQFLIIFTSIYALFILFNFINSIFIFKTNSLFFFGFLAFVLCDLIVVIGAMEGLSFISISNKTFLNKIGSFDWVFYLIAQYFLISAISFSSLNLLFKSGKNKINLLKLQAADNSEKIEK